MKKSQKFVISLEDETTIANSRGYSDTSARRNAPPVTPLAPGPAIVVPVPSRFSAGVLALAAAGALLCGALGGWAWGISQHETLENPPAQTETQAEQPFTEIIEETPAPPPAQPEAAFTARIDDKKDRRTAPKPVLKPAKRKPAAEKKEEKEKAPPKTEDSGSPNNGDTRPRRANGDNERAKNDSKSSRKNDADLNHRRQ